MKEKEQENKEEKKPEEETIEKQKADQKKYADQTRIIVVIMAVALISFIGIYVYAQQQQKVSFNGITFTKEKEGSILYYKSLLGYVSATGEQVPFILKLRTNPEELSTIQVNGEVQLQKDAIITLDPSIMQCNNTYATLIDLSMFLKAFGTSAGAATTDPEFALENNLSIADCRNAMNQTVLVFKESNVTQIDRERVQLLNNCYVLSVNNCEIRESYERFIIAYIQDSLL